MLRRLGSANFSFFQLSPLLPLQTKETRLDLSKAKLDYMEDTGLLEHTVPQLAHGLDQFLSGELVFGDHGVGKLPALNEYTNNETLLKISGYTKPSEDTGLLTKCLEHSCRYISSTSSISNPLICLQYIFSSFRKPETVNVFEPYKVKEVNWMVSYRKPTTFFLRNIKDGVQAIVNDHGVMPQNNEVLMKLGHVIEYFLTHTKDETDSMMRGEPIPLVNNYYRYAKVNSELMLRSQIDCLSYDKEGKPYVFEIKSRVCAPIRYDVENYLEYKDYEINKKRGLYESFEREYFDLIRGAFLKYVMQVKIGRMEGAFIAYHNTEDFYGYEYINLEEMAHRTIGNMYNLDVSFICISKMLTTVLDKIRECLPEYKEEDLKIGFYSCQKTGRLIVFIEPMVITKEYHPIETREVYKNTTDYFLKYHPIKNPVFRMSVLFNKYVNGIKLNNPDVMLTPEDRIEIGYEIDGPIPALKTEYIHFLYEAEKEEDVFQSFMYKGGW